MEDEVVIVFEVVGEAEEEIVAEEDPDDSITGDTDDEDIGDDSEDAILELGTVPKEEAAAA